MLQITVWRDLQSRAGSGTAIHKHLLAETRCAAQQRPLRGFGIDVTGPAQGSTSGAQTSWCTGREDGAHRRARLERAGRRWLLRRRGGRGSRGRRGGLCVILCLQPPRELFISLACRRACAARHHCTPTRTARRARSHAGAGASSPLPSQHFRQVHRKLVTAGPRRLVQISFPEQPDAERLERLQAHERQALRNRVRGF
jgi:hypothetical protein